MAAGRAKASSQNGLGAVVWCGLAVDSVVVARGGGEGGLKLSKTTDSGRWLVAGHKCGPDDGGAGRGLPAWVVQ